MLSERPGMVGRPPSVAIRPISRFDVLAANSFPGRRTLGESDAAIIRKAYEDFAQGDIPAVFAVFDAAITWHVPGHSPLSGSDAGHDQIVGFFRRTMELSGGAFSIDVHNVLADGDLVVSLVTVDARRNGVSVSFPEVHVRQTKNGKAIEFRKYRGDEQREDQFWSRISPLGLPLIVTGAIHNGLAAASSNHQVWKWHFSNLAWPLSRVPKAPHKGR